MTSAGAFWSRPEVTTAARMLILVRHGESVANAQGLLVGRTDAELTQKGMAQASSVGLLLRDPVLRAAVQPAQPGARHRGAPGRGRAGRGGRPLGRGGLRRVRVPAPRATFRRTSGASGKAIPSFAPPEASRWPRSTPVWPRACDELFATDGLGRACRGRRRRGGQPRHADQGGGGLGARDGRRAVLAAPSADGVGDPHRVGNGHPVLHGFNEVVPNRDTSRHSG